MNHNQFNALSATEKWNIIFGVNAKFVAYRDYYGHKVSLYDCGEFFAEYYYFAEDNSVTKIEGIPMDDKRIDLYINHALNSY